MVNFARFFGAKHREAPTEDIERITIDEKEQEKYKSLRKKVKRLESILKKLSISQATSLSLPFRIRDGKGRIRTPFEYAVCFRQNEKRSLAFIRNKKNKQDKQQRRV